MNGYFTPQGRKVGVVALLMACLVMALWARSYSVYDAIELPLMFGIATGEEGHLFGRWQLMTMPSTSFMDESPPATGYPVICTAAGNFVLVPIINVRYEYIVTPLVLLSAFLLLSKPRSKPTATQPTVDAISHQNAQDAI